LQAVQESDRLDRWLGSNVADLSRSRLQTLIATGQVRLNDRICTSKKQVIIPGDRVTIEIPEPQPTDIEPNPISLDVLYEDDSLIIINKPAGLVVHPAPGHSNDTLVNALIARCPHIAEIGGELRPGIVHRLDKDTTGAIAVAKTDIAYRSLQAQLKAKTAQREYLGVVCGVPKTESGTVDRRIARHPRDRKKMAVVETGGRNAITHWQVRDRAGNYTLIHFRLETGRTHQIRVHCASLGLPLVGDRVYGSGNSAGVNLPGQALHAWKLTLQHPVSGEELQAIAPLPAAFEKLLAKLQLSW